MSAFLAGLARFAQGGPLEVGLGARAPVFHLLGIGAVSADRVTFNFGAFGITGTRREAEADADEGRRKVATRVGAAGEKT